MIGESEGVFVGFSALSAVHSSQSHREEKGDKRTSEQLSSPEKASVTVSWPKMCEAATHDPLVQPAELEAVQSSGPYEAEKGQKTGFFAEVKYFLMLRGKKKR